MKWDINKLKSKIKELEVRISLVTDPIQKYSLIHDLTNLKDMVNYLSSEPIFSCDEYKYKILDTDFAIDMAYFLQINGDRLQTLLLETSYLHHVPTKYRPNSSISLDEYDELLKDFFANFNPKLYFLYQKYKNEARIEINTKRYQSVTCSGECHYILSEKEAYLSSRHNNRLSTICILPHELAHAEQFRTSDSIITSQNKSYSLLCEAYPIFIEYAFLEFLKQTKYSKYAYRKEGSKINNFLCALEYDLGCLKTSIISVRNKEVAASGYMQNRYSNMLIMSNLVALYWLELYRENPSELLKQLEEFNQKFGVEHFSSFFENNNIKDITDGMHMSLRRYLKNYSKN